MSPVSGSVIACCISGRFQEVRLEFGTIRVYSLAAQAILSGLTFRDENVGTVSLTARRFEMVLKRSARGEARPFIVMDVMGSANTLETAGEEILHLEIGQPSTPAPRGVLAASREALAVDRLGYTGALGLEALRSRIAEHYRDLYGVIVPSDRIAVTTGSSGGFTLAFLAAFDTGDRVALAAPGYPAYKNILTALGIEPVELLSTEEDRYQPTVALLARLDREIDGLIVASPANPTGTMLSREDMNALVRWCADHGVRLVSDEIYHGLTYTMPGTTALEFTDNAFVINSFSKYYSMTGWRIGWMVMPPELSRSVECLAQNLFISAPTLSQLGALAAFDCRDELEENLARYAANRNLLLKELTGVGFGKLAPADGAFYIYADVGHMTNDSEAFCRALLHEAGIAIAPGTDFDRQRGHATVRISFAGSLETMEKAVDRLSGWIRAGG